MALLLALGWAWRAARTGRERGPALDENASARGVGQAEPPPNEERRRPPRVRAPAPRGADVAPAEAPPPDRIAAERVSLQLPTGGGEPPDRAVRARFVTSRGPAAGVTLEGATSDADGRIAFRLALGWRGFLIAVHPDGSQFRVEVPQDDTVDVDLGTLTIAAPGAIAGTIVDDADRPIAGATVTLRSAELDCRTVGTAQTDAAGRFAFDGVTHGFHEVVVQAPAPAAEAVDAKALGARRQGLAAGDADVRMVVRPMFPVVVRLRDEKGESPISGPWIACQLHRAGDPAGVHLHELRHRVTDVVVLLDEPGWYDVEVRMFDSSRCRRDGRVAAVELRSDRENVIELAMRAP